MLVDFAMGAGVGLSSAFFVTALLDARKARKAKEPLAPACKSRYHARYSAGPMEFSQVITCQQYEHTGKHSCNLGRGYETIAFVWSNQDALDYKELPVNTEVPDVFAEAWGDQPKTEDGS